MTVSKKNDLLNKKVKHINIAEMNVCSMVDAMQHTAFQARNLARAAHIYQQMLEDEDCTIILCLAGSLVSAGMKNIIVDLIKNKMIDAIVSTGANIVDQDFFEALGFSHYQGSPTLNDNELRELAIDRIYDTLINE
jgi:deoxyhypusine synthase